MGWLGSNALVRPQAPTLMDVSVQIRELVQTEERLAEVGKRRLAWRGVAGGGIRSFLGVHESRGQMQFVVSRFAAKHVAIGRPDRVRDGRVIAWRNAFRERYRPGA